jgi:hypothetical protein
MYGDTLVYTFYVLRTTQKSIMNRFPNNDLVNNDGYDIQCDVSDNILTRPPVIRYFYVQKIYIHKS